MYLCSHICFRIYSGLKEINEDEFAKRNSAELEEIFHLLVDCTKASSRPENSTPPQITPIKPSDRSVTQSVLIKSPIRHLSTFPVLSEKSPTTIKTTHGSPGASARLVHGSDCRPECVVNCINYVLSGICRVAFLLELALLALQVKHQKVAAECLKELKSAGEAVSVPYSLKTSGSSKSP